jgi:hypothetical protein
MAKTTAPLLGFKASGQIGKVQVYSNWKGRQYARSYVTPANPNTSGQQLTRNAFRWLQEVAKFAPSYWQAVWVAGAKGQVMTWFNLFTSKNLSSLRTATDITGLVFSPGVKGGPAPVSITATGSSGSFSVTMVTPETPTGWTLNGSTGICLLSQNPQTDTDYTSYQAAENDSPYTLDFSSIPAGDYEVGVFLRWQKPDLESAYSPSINTTVTVS